MRTKFCILFAFSSFKVMIVMGQLPYVVYYSNSGNLNCRSEACVDPNNIIDKFYTNDKAVAISTQDNSCNYDWYKVDLPGNSSFSSAYRGYSVDGSGYFVAQTDECFVQFVNLGGSWLNIRPYAGATGSNYIYFDEGPNNGLVVQGKEYQYFPLKNTTPTNSGGYNWYNIYISKYCDQDDGWVREDYVDIICPCGTEPTTPIINASDLSICQGSSTTLSVNNTCSGCDYSWSNGAAGTSISVSSAGTYSCTASNDCGTSSQSNSLTVTIVQVPSQPGTISGSNTPCEGSSQTYSINEVSGATSYIWTKPTGWNGSSSSETIDLAVGSSGGLITVKAANECGNSATASSLNVTAINNPVANFTYSTGTSCNVTFSNSSTNATDYLWDFGDGATSLDINPAHTYSSSGTYEVTLTSGNSCGNSPQYAQSITLSCIIGIDQVTRTDQFSIFPNPFNNQATIDFTTSEENKISIRVFDLIGREIKTLVEGIYAPGDYRIAFDRKQLANGIYLVKIVSNGNVNSQLVVIE